MGDTSSAPASRKRARKDERAADAARDAAPVAGNGAADAPPASHDGRNGAVCDDNGRVRLSSSPFTAQRKRKHDGDRGSALAGSESSSESTTSRSAIAVAVGARALAAADKDPAARAGGEEASCRAISSEPSCSALCSRELAVLAHCPAAGDHAPCLACGSLYAPNSMLLCDGCNDACHLACATPPLKVPPRGTWFCAGCSRSRDAAPPAHVPAAAASAPAAPLCGTCGAEATPHTMIECRASCPPAMYPPRNGQRSAWACLECADTAEAVFWPAQGSIIVASGRPARVLETGLWGNGSSAALRLHYYHGSAREQVMAPRLYSAVIERPSVAMVRQALAADAESADKTATVGWRALFDAEGLPATPSNAQLEALFAQHAADADPTSLSGFPAYEPRKERRRQPFVLTPGEVHPFESVMDEHGVGVKAKPPPYSKIVRNIWLVPRPPPLQEDDVSVCHCPPDSGCGPQCINRMLIVECNAKLCPCGERCTNQRLQQRRYAKTRIFRTKSRGWGLAAAEPIAADDLITEYIGEVLSKEMANERLHEALQKDGPEASGDGASSSSGDALRGRMITRSDVPIYIMSMGDEVIDAGRRGNEARFMNHSCDPNARAEPWSVNGETRVALVAVRDIAAGEELTFDYNWEHLGGERQRCFCGARTCPGFFGGTKKKVAPTGVKPVGRRPRVDAELGVAGLGKLVHREDDFCLLCHGGGDLALCDAVSKGVACPRAYHLECLNFVPNAKEKWRCPWHYCDECGRAASLLCRSCATSLCKRCAESKPDMFVPLADGEAPDAFSNATCKDCVADNRRLPPPTDHGIRAILDMDLCANRPAAPLRLPAEFLANARPSLSKYFA